MLFAAGLIFALTSNAQQMPLTIDKDVRIGKLPNGLTYYIRHNEKPKGQADFYIAQKVGSILEEDNQRGLAHFLEHMCFNGTKSFPGNSLIDWLETVGVKFGQNLNAYTSVDETVYNISNVPVARESVQDSCLLILHDWANDLLLDDEEIDKERGVIHEEWRRSMVGQMRIVEKLLPTVYPDSKYGYRLPIGTMEIVDNFQYQDLRDYYEKWYRPDQQGIIVVGDIDVDRIESKIKEIFADIEMPENAAERVYFPVPDTKGTIYAIGSDKEQTVAVVQMFFKTEAFPNEMKGDAQYLIQKYVMDLIELMLDNRFNDMMTDPDAPFAQAGCYYGNFFLAKTADAFTLVGVSKDDNIQTTLEAIYRELLRAKDGGFTEGEYQRARDEYMSRIEKAYNGRNDRESGPYVQEYVRHFIDNEPIPSIEDKYQLMQMIAPMIPLQAINQVLPELITNDNRVVLALLPEKEGVAEPTEEELSAIIAKVDGEDIEAYVDEMKSEPLIPALPAAGKIISETANDQWGATEITLSNGVKVIVKPTKFKEDEILFSATARNGSSTVPDSKSTDLKFLDMVLGQHGLGDYTYSDLQKYLSGKQVSVQVEIDNFDRSVSGTTTPKDLQTMMELIYMNFTNFNITADEFKALQNMMEGILKNAESNPQFIFSRDLNKVLYTNPRRQLITPEEVVAADRESILEIIRSMTANAADYEFVFVGNIDMDTLRPLLEQYIATLPADASKVNDKVEVDPSLVIIPGLVNESSTTAMQTPQTWVFIASTAEMPYDSKNAKLASIAGQILSKRLLNTVREDMGAVYSIHASGNMGRTPGRNTAIQTAFPMKPEMKAEVLDFIKAEIERMQSDIKPEELSKVTEFMIKNANEALELNSSWLGAITGTALNGVDTFNGSEEILKAITVEDVQNFLKEMLAQNNYLVFTLDPENAEAPTAE